MLTANKTLLSNGISIQPPSTAEVDLLLVQDCNPNTGHCLNSCIRQTYNPCVSSPYRLPIMVLGSRIVTFNAEILSDKSLQSHCDEIIIVNSHAIIECDNARIYIYAWYTKIRQIIYPKQCWSSALYQHVWAIIPLQHHNRNPKFASIWGQTWSAMHLTTDLNECFKYSENLF